MQSISIKDLKPLYPSIMCSFEELSRMLGNDVMEIKEGYNTLYKVYPYAGDFFIYTINQRVCIPTGGNTVIFIKNKLPDVRKDVPILFTYGSIKEIFGKKTIPDERIESIEGINKIGKKADGKYTVKATLSNFVNIRRTQVCLGVSNYTAESMYKKLRIVVGKTLSELIVNI